MGSPDLSHAAWRKSSFSANGGNCVEIAEVYVRDSRAVAVRDSKNPHGSVLLFTPEEWRLFTAEVQARRVGLI